LLALLPLVAFICIFLVAGNLFRLWGWRRTFIRSFVATGSFMVLGNESLSLIGGITRLGLAVLWSLPILAACLWAVRTLQRGKSISLPEWRVSFTFGEWVLLLGAVSIVGVTAAVAWIAPPNTWDSLTYHMARVAHWAQNHSLAPFATGNERQNFMPPAAETAMLQVYVLAGGDRLVNFVEWFAMLGSVVGVTLIARDLGAARLGQVFAALFVLTLPMGIAQASSTMTDYVVAFWTVCIASESVWLIQRRSVPAEFAFIALAAGLAINTKPTAFVYLLPFVVSILAVWIRRYRFARLLRLGLMSVAIILVVNAGYISRNMGLFGNPLGSSSRISGHANEILDWRVFISNVLRNASLHAGTPNPYVNKGIALAVRKIHQLIGLDPADPQTSAHLTFRISPPSLNEAKAGNLAQALLILAASILALWKRRSLDPLALGFASIVVTTFLVLSLTFKFSTFGSRYHLPFFVLFAPVAGYVFATLVPPKGVRLIALGLIVACVPWLVNLDPRPLLSPGGSNVPSILTRPRDSLYFVLDPSAEQPYRDMVSAIQGANCSSVGLMLSGGAAEYPLWALLGAPRPDLTLEAIVGGTASARLADPDFEPCAVLCDASCAAGLTSFRGLDQTYSRSGYRLFLGGPQPAAP